MTLEQTQALDIARALAGIGVPVFVAVPDPTEPTGFKLPIGWQQTQPDPRVVDHWQPGMALAAVMGCGLDLLDVDPRSGGDLASLDGQTPTSYAAALTPSGGVHSFIRSLGVRSRDNVAPGIDVKAGDAQGQGRGFAFIAPTIRASKVTGQLVAYRWATPPDLTRLAAAADDTSGAGLAAMINRLRDKAGQTGMTTDAFMKAGPWTSVEATLAEGRNNGVHKLAAALRGRGGLLLEDALDVMYRRVWPLIDQTKGGHEFTADEFEQVIRAAWRQYADGDEERAAAAAVPPQTDGQGGVVAAPDPVRYFGPGGLQAATLAADVMALGPLAQGVDDILWSYQQGAWRPDRHAVRARLARLLGQRHRRGHLGTIEDIVRAYVETITCDPLPDLINFRNGLLHWKTGELLPHAPEVPSTVQLGVDYDPDAACPAFERFLSQVVPPDMVETVWELIGYLMYSGNPLHKAVMLTGQGRNGKGTLLRVVLTLLGRRNVTTVSLHDLVNTRFTTASLFGKLANIAGDIDAGYLENTATFKAITGGDTISAEHKGRDRFDFTPWAVPVFSANKIPASADTTVGYLSRWLVVPFPHNFTGREDRRLDAKLHTETELRGIAARGIAALPRLLDRGDFPVTESGQAAQDDFVRRVDQVRTWLADCADIAPEHPWVNRTELYEAYKRWALRDGHKALRASEFYDRIEAAGAEPAKVHGTRGFNRVRIIDDGWVTAYGTPQGAQGAGIPHSVQEGAGQGAGAPPNLAGSPETPQSATEQAETAPAPAPSANDGLTCENAEVTHESGAEGAVHPHPPSHAYAHEGGYVLPAPPAPNPPKVQKAAAKAEAKAQARLDAIAAVAGSAVPLPALVTRDGGVRPIPLDAADTLLRSVTNRGQALTVDVEHTGYPIGHADYRLKTVQLGVEEFAVVLDAAALEQATVVRDQLGAARKLHAHSATADLVPLAYADLTDADSAWDRMYDTVIPAKLADPASTGSDPGLKKIAAVVLGDLAVSPAADTARADLFKAGKWLTTVEVTTPVERSGWAQVDPGCETMVRYAASDVIDDAALARRLPQPPPDVLERERTAQRMTARVAHRGLRIDGDHVRVMLDEHRPAKAKYAEVVRSFGIDNPGSGPQVAAKLIELGVRLPPTKTGRPSVAEGVLEPMRGADGSAGALIDAVLDYRHHATAIGTFLEPYLRLVEHGDGRARPTVYTLGADTGRMSCVRPNLQQVPREGGFRACVTADPGYLLISADFSGVELRVGAALSQDRNLMRMLDAGIDLHGEIARQVFGPNATKANRYTVKPGVFAWLYGGSVPTIAAQLGVSQQVAQAIVDTLANIAPGLAEWCRMTTEGVKAGRTQFRTYSGRIVHMPVKAPHAGPNYCIQGTARELLVDTLLRWQDTRWGRAVLLPVHDEIVAVVPEAEAADATTALAEAMTTELFGVRIIAEASEPSFAWADAA